jgi:hypothetical protein
MLPTIGFRVFSFWTVMENRMCTLCYVDDAMKKNIAAQGATFREATKSPFGASDEIGMLNLITADSRDAIMSTADAGCIDPCRGGRLHEADVLSAACPSLRWSRPFSSVDAGSQVRFAAAPDIARRMIRSEEHGGIHDEHVCRTTEPRPQ